MVRVRGSGCQWVRVRQSWITLAGEAYARDRRQEECIVGSADAAGLE